jgi:hypothetical protein
MPDGIPMEKETETESTFEERLKDIAAKVTKVYGEPTARAPAVAAAALVFLGLLCIAEQLERKP